MFTATLNNYGTNSNIFSTVLTPSAVSMDLYNQCRETILGLINTSDPSVVYRAIGNAENSFNGYGLHEKIIHGGRSVVDLSVGVLDYPWSAADAYPDSEVSVDVLEGIAFEEDNFTIATRLHSIVRLVQNLPPYVHVYYYTGRDGTRAVTIDDEFNLVKANIIISYFGI